MHTCESLYVDKHAPTSGFFFQTFFGRHDMPKSSSFTYFYFPKLLCAQKLKIPT